MVSVPGTNLSLAFGPQLPEWVLDYLHSSSVFSFDYFNGQAFDNEANTADSLEYTLS